MWHNTAKAHVLNFLPIWWRQLIILLSYSFEVLYIGGKQEGILYEIEHVWCRMDTQKFKELHTYVYWTVHRIDSWIKRDQLYVTCFIISLFNAQHVSDVNTAILRSMRLIFWVISWVVLFWFDVCWCYVVVWLWWCGIRMQASACIRIPHHPSQTTR